MLSISNVNFARKSSSAISKSNNNQNYNTSFNLQPNNDTVSFGRVFSKADCLELKVLYKKIDAIFNEFSGSKETANGIIVQLEKPRLISKQINNDEKIIIQNGYASGYLVTASNKANSHYLLGSDGSAAIKYKNADDYLHLKNIEGGHEDAVILKDQIRKALSI